MNTATSLPQKASWRDYLALTKPKVISLLLFTAVGSMFIAARAMPDWVPLVGVIVGGYMSTGGAGVFNMILDRDIDAQMKRTARRPLVTGVISVRNALIFGLAISVGSFVVLTLMANLQTALLALSGLLFYVVVYTWWLKRTTWQNIVIGGIAGAVLPLLGWTAVNEILEPMAWVLFGLITLWTPVHFWALAFVVKDQYASVGIPMAPSVLGTKGTLHQMLLYTGLTVLASLLPYVMREADLPYLAVALTLNILLVWKMAQLYVKGRQTLPGQNIERHDALAVYKFSMSYLALVMLALALDRLISAAA